MTSVSDSFFFLAPWVIFLPAIGLLINLLVGKKLGSRGAGVVASLATGSAFVVALLLALSLTRHPEGVVYRLAEWINIGALKVDWAMKIDTLSTVMMLVVSGVGTLIHIYAIGYMYQDVRHNGDVARYPRFFVYFNLFIVAMMTLITADNYLMLFVGWEGVGLCSFLLIGFWYEKGAKGTGNAKAAKKAFIVNRIGDFGLLIALFLIFWNFGTFEFEGVFKAANALPAAAVGGVILLITLFMLLGVTGKSAQLPLYVWLPDAMAGPTPVSALIHAATMVTAGVYLVARSQPLFVLAPAAQNVTMWVGALTALFAATIAIGQYDIKKVLAYSTISQLGFMVAAVGMGAITAGMFHLITHAFFKALLFLAAGSVILGMESGAGGHHSAGEGHHETSVDPQDMRNMGGMQQRMPVTFWVYLIGALALSGIAPLAGFFSKDEILASASHQSTQVFVLLVIAAFFTAFYMGRQLLMIFGGKARTESASRAEESPLIITIPLMILAALSVLGGLINFPGLHWLESWLEHTLELGEPEAFSIATAGLSLAVALTGLFIAWLVYGRRTLGSPDRPDPLQSMGWLYRALENKWWVDEIYRFVFVRPYRYISREVLSVWADQEIIDGLVNDMGRATSALSRGWSVLQNGFVRSYALFIVFGVVAMLTYLLFR
ncbi:MAG: NADH-quinone oxidoreductase subunit L [Anaerolineae bacterium]|nr:NADH-quinone oxidoreductase subunit L [Anaerolineae bacterium]